MKNYVNLITALTLFMSFASQNIFADNEGDTPPDFVEKDTIPATNWRVDFSTTFISQHIWRGFVSGTAPAIEPLVDIRHKGLSISAWGAYAIDNSYREIDFWATYDWKYVGVGVYDYYCPIATKPPEFFNVDPSETDHLFEAQLVLKGGEQLPLTLTAATFFAGADLDSTGKQLYSTYLELGYGHTFGKNRVDFAVGMTPFEGMYADNLSIFNYNARLTRDIIINEKFSIPLFCNLAYNAETTDLYFNVGFTLRAK